MFDLLVHISCFLTFASFWVKDILWLRLLSVASSVTWIAYVAMPDHWIPASLLWNLLYITINVVRIVQLVLEKVAVDFSDEEAELFRTVFAGLQPTQFHRLLRAGEWRSFSEGETIIVQDAPPDMLSLVVCGEATVVKSGREIARIGPHQFVGELSYLSKRPATATVTTLTGGRRLVWSRQSLVSLFRRAPSLEHAFHAIVTRDLTVKLEGVR